MGGTLFGTPNPETDAVDDAHSLDKLEEASDVSEEENQEFVGTKELALLLRWSTGHVSEYLRRGKLPGPAFRIAAGPVWRTRDIYPWSIAHKVGSLDKQRLRHDFGIPRHEPVGAALALQGLISQAEGNWLDAKMPPTGGRQSDDAAPVGDKETLL